LDWVAYLLGLRVGRVKGLLNRLGESIKYRGAGSQGVAEGGASHPLLPTVIHRSDQLSTGQGVGVGSASRKGTPPVVVFSRGVYCVPVQKIFAKVRLQYSSDLRLYIV
jgi:hypothetical protein